VNLTSKEIEKALNDFLIGKSKKNKVKKQSKKIKKEVKHFYLYILKDLHDGLDLSKIQKKHSIYKQKLYYYLKLLKSEGLIVKVGYGTWELTQKGEIYLMNSSNNLSRRKKGSQRFVSDPKTNQIHIHNLRIKFPLIEDKSSKFWQKESDFSYVGKKYYYFHELFTVEKIGNVTIEIKLDFWISANNEKDFKNNLIKALDSRIDQAVNYISDKGIEVNYSKRSVINIELAIKTPFDSQIDWSKIVHEYLDLKRLREKIFEGDLNQPGKAIIDRSHRTRETNSIRYGEKVLAMPETIDHLSNSLIPVLSEFKDISAQRLISDKNLAININTHTAVLKNLKGAVSDLRNEINIFRDRVLTDEELDDMIEKPTDPKIKMVKCRCGAEYSNKLYCCPKCKGREELKKYL